MPMYLGRDGQIYNRPVPGSSLIDADNVAPPPRPRNPHSPDPAPPPAEAGFFRKGLFWLTALGSAGGMGYAMGTALSTFAFDNAGAEGIVGSLSGMLAHSSPVLLCVFAVFLAFCFGVSTGEEHNYNLSGLLFTLLSTGGICLLGATGLALLPFIAALVGYLLIFGLVIGVVASLFGG